MDKPPILVSGRPFDGPVGAVLQAGYTLHVLEPGPDWRERLPADAPSIRAAVVTGSRGFPPEVVETLPALELLALNSVGTDSIDLAHALGRGLTVTNTPGVLDADTADLAIGLMIDACRRISAGDRHVRSGDWSGGGRLPLATSVSGKRIGIAGLGRIGREIARRAEPFASELAYTTRRAVEGAPWRRHESVLELARESDILILAVPGGVATHGLVDAAVLDALGPAGVLVNVARGSVVDEPALVAALRDGRLGAAGLDVFADEPNVPEALLALDNVVLSPHRGSATAETRLAMAELVRANLDAFFAGRPLVTPVAG